MSGNPSKGVLRQQYQEAVQDLINQSFDPVFGTLVAQHVGSPDGVNMYTVKVNSDGSYSVSSSDLVVRSDDTGTYTYFGFAAPGTATSASTWKIKRLTNADNTIVYAGGTALFNNVWDNHTSLTYS
jgi:hypothetical protein